MKTAKPFILGASLCAVFYLGGCSRAPDEPAGRPVSLASAELDATFPDSLRRWASWQRKGNRAMSGDNFNEAVYCFHKAEESYPKERPEFPAGSEWAERSWSGHPFATYVAKAKVYTILRDLVPAEHYLGLAQKYQEHPQDKREINRVQAQLAYAREDYARVAELLEGSEDVFDSLIVAVARHKAGKEEASADVRRIFREAQSTKPGSLLLRRRGWLPRDVWRVAAGLSEAKKS